MTLANKALLADRGVVRVFGDDAGKLLQGIISNDMDLLAHHSAIHAGLLSPQGKILFEFFVLKEGAGFLLETAHDRTADLCRRLAMYKLRAQATISDASADFRVLVVWPPPGSESDGQGTAFVDPRLPALGLRVLAKEAMARKVFPAANEVAPEAWHRHRIALGVPEAGKDYALGNAFPHEANFDLLHGVSFTKGCFVGQEVVSRMHNRAGVRKRVVPIEGSGPLAPGAEITAAAAVIGTVGSAAGEQGLAMLRLDRAAEAQAKGLRLEVAGVPIVLRRADFFRPDELLAPAGTR